MLITLKILFSSLLHANIKNMMMWFYLACTCSA